MAIIVVLAAVAIPTFGKQLETSREAADMQVLRSAYEEVLSIATLDATDGKLDGGVDIVKTTTGTGKNAKTTVTGTDLCATAKDGIEFVVDSGGSITKGGYKVTLANMPNPAKFSQGTEGWDFISGLLSGQTAPNVTAITKTVTFNLELKGGNLVFQSSEGVTPITCAS